MVSMMIGFLTVILFLLFVMILVSSICGSISILGLIVFSYKYYVERNRVFKKFMLSYMLLFIVSLIYLIISVNILIHVKGELYDLLYR